MFPQSLHFQEPLWLFVFIPLALILWIVSRGRSNTSAWSNVIDNNLLPYLLQGKETKVSNLPKWLLAIGGLLAILALADPVWEKVPRPVFQTNSARVIVLDLSNSMLIDDLKPSRLARARFKIEDILSNAGEGQTGLVVFAGDAFTASPLTRDVDTIRNLLQIFTPRLMPSQGSRVDYGLKKAHELLKQANIHNGQVLLIADGISNPDAAYREAKALRNHGHTVSVLAVGTEEGGLLRLRTKRVNIKLDADSLQETAKNGGGGYHTITSDNSDLNTVLKDAIDNTTNDNKQNQAKSKDFKSDEWKSTGPYLLLLLLPLAALAFRKGWLLTLFFTIGLVGIFTPTQTVYAEDAKAAEGTKNAEDKIENSSLSASLQKQWQKLWLNKEQRADNAIKQKRFKQASQLSQEPMRKGSAAYKSNDYKSALTDFQNNQSADARYNEGNTQAKLKNYKEAIESYEKALKLDPNMEDAKANKKAVEDFLKKQKQKNKKDSKQNDKNKDKKNKDKKDKKNKDQKKGDKKSDDKNQEKKDSDKSDKSDNKENQFDKANKDLDKGKDKDSDKQDKEGEESDPNKNPENADKKEAKKDKDKDKKTKAEQKKADEANKKEAEKAAKIKADELSKEEKMAAEQWLRRIPDDPGGLLRRKFRRQYQRSNRRPNDDEQPW